MARVTRLENFYRCRLLRVSVSLRIDDGSQPATRDGVRRYGRPSSFSAGPRWKLEPPAERVNGKPVFMPAIRWAWRIIAYSPFAVGRPPRPRRKLARWNIRGLRANVIDDPVDIRRDRRCRVVHDQCEGLCSPRCTGPVNHRVLARAVAAEL